LILVHPHAAGAIGDNQDMNRTKGASNIFPWMRMACHLDVLLQEVSGLIVKKLISCTRSRGGKKFYKTIPIKT